MIAREPTKLKILFMEKGLLNQKQIALALFVSQNTVTRWLKGKVMSERQANRLASFLGKDVDELFTAKQNGDDSSSAATHRST